MSNQANAPAPAAQIKGFDVEKLKDDEILKLEAEMKAKLELLQKAKGEREEKIKVSALTAIKKAIDEAVASGAVTNYDVTAYLVAEGYVVAPKAAATATGGTKGRRAISDEDVLFSFPYQNEEGGRSMTLKLDADSKMPAAHSGAYKVIKGLQEKGFEELKSHFTAKFHNEFMHTEESVQWVEIFFPKLQQSIQMIANKAKA